MSTWGLDGVGPPTRTVLILAFPDMEVLDYAGPYEVFNVAGELSEPTAFRVHSVAVAPGPVVGRGGFTVLPDHTIDDHPPPDLVIIPGGAGSRRLLADDRLLDWVQAQAGRVEHLAAVCTGALVLAAAGLLDGLEATTHHEAFGELARLSASTRIVRDARFVRSGPALWTSGGISAGIDLALELVDLCAGPATRAAVETEMEWGWPSEA